jgi:hypothetical protein
MTADASKKRRNLTFRKLPVVNDIKRCTGAIHVVAWTESNRRDNDFQSQRQGLL